VHAGKHLQSMMENGASSITFLKLFFPIKVEGEHWALQFCNTVHGKGACLTCRGSSPYTAKPSQANSRQAKALH